MIGAAVLSEAIAGHGLPALANFGRINGFPVSAGLGATPALLLMTTLGEQTVGAASCNRSRRPGSDRPSQCS
jgi:hypothetical protein